ncbi:hypothetical protein [Azospirillum halopraeferens]|uniref:hypothetical protein n=1 Tax=Azospirillum halopraeferens TaxID=34010 RepID=UPI0003FB11A9|nr:hypothetical protein [Azospirillum halopraeferens]
MTRHRFLALGSAAALALACLGGTAAAQSDVPATATSPSAEAGSPTTGALPGDSLMERREGAIGGEPVTQGDDAAADDSITDDAASDDPVTDDAASDDAITDDAATDDAAVDGTATTDDTDAAGQAVAPTGDLPDDTLIEQREGAFGGSVTQGGGEGSGQQ